MMGANLDDGRCHWRDLAEVAINTPKSGGKGGFCGLLLALKHFVPLKFRLAQSIKAYSVVSLPRFLDRSTGEKRVQKTAGVCRFLAVGHEDAKRIATPYWFRPVFIVIACQWRTGWLWRSAVDWAFCCRQSYKLAPESFGKPILRESSRRIVRTNFLNYAFESSRYPLRLERRNAM
jgi:hypothetical protein